tara:strand:- start:12 stop:266 length:255 start_codon:yes stop_codon:yes gene_type:complete
MKNNIVKQVLHYFNIVGIFLLFSCSNNLPKHEFDELTLWVEDLRYFEVSNYEISTMNHKELSKAWSKLYYKHLIIETENEFFKN